MNREDYERLCEIKDEMEELVAEAKNLLHQSKEDRFAYERAKAYWLGWMESYFEEKSESCSCTFPETLREVAPDSDEEDSEG